MTEPTPNELSRRLDDLRDELRTGMKGLNERLDRMPTSELMTAYLAKTDTEITSLRDDVIELTKALSRERSERESGDKDIVAEAATAKRWAVGVAISGAVAVIGFVGFLLQVAGGSPT